MKVGHLINILGITRCRCRQLQKGKTKEVTHKGKCFQNKTGNEAEQTAEGLGAGSRTGAEIGLGRGRSSIDLGGGCSQGNLEFSLGHCSGIKDPGRSMGGTGGEDSLPGNVRHVAKSPLEAG